MDIHDDDPTHQLFTSRKDVILKNQQVTIKDFHAAFHSNEDTDMVVCKWTELLCHWPVIKIKCFPCLKMEADLASKTPCFIKKLVKDKGEKILCP